MFTEKKRIYYAKILGFKNTNDFDLFAKRYLNFLEKDKLTKNRIMGGFFILLEIQKERINANKNTINFEGIKNAFIKKYSNEILELRKNGLGSQAIVNALYENHRAEVSRGTIEKFYKLNGL